VVLVILQVQIALQVFRGQCLAMPRRGVAPAAKPAARYRRATKAELQNRTAKARTQNLLNRQAKKIEKENSAKESSPKGTFSTFASHLQHWFFTLSFFKALYQEDAYDGDQKSFERDRTRSIFSLLKSVVTVLLQMFGIQQANETNLFHVLNTHIVDDTSTRMRGPAHTDRTTVYTIMNAVQALHVRFANTCECEDVRGTCCSSLRVPLSLIVLENADAKAIHKSFTSCAFITANGPGQMFKRFGIPEGIAESAVWKSFVFVGDALRANTAAFRLECAEILKKSRERDGAGQHLAFQIKCGIHQLSLIRKPVVLMVPKLWSTVVRLSHLYESLAFRKKFARTLAGILCKSFTYLEITQLPATAVEWQAVHKYLLESFRTQSKLRRKNFESLVEFFNGDYSSDCIFHFCTPKRDGTPCCPGPTESLTKALQLMVPFFARGYPVPLLYRFKHYDEAITFIATGCAMHKLLVRTLGQMDLDAASAPSEAQSQLIDKLLQDVELGGEGSDGSAAATFCEDLFPDNGSFHAYNAKRKQLVHQEVIKGSFGQQADILNFMIKPVDGQINSLFRRSERLTKLTLLGPQDPKWKINAESTRNLFLSVVSGSFGWNIISTYCNLMMHELGSLALTGVDLTSQGNLQTCFTMMLVIITDTWKRFVHDYDTFPFKFFQLLESNLAGFVTMWDGFQTCKSHCGKCFDPAFSKALLAGYPQKLAEQPPHVQQRVFQEVQLLLHDLATYSPLTSDPVEVKNGQVQNVASRRGNQAIKTPPASREASFLQSLIRDYELVKHWVEEQTLPPKSQISGILRNVGLWGGSNQNTKSCNPHSKKRRVSDALFPTLANVFPTASYTNGKNYGFTSIPTPTHSIFHFPAGLMDCVLDVLW
jgi:hypothetical protein